METSEFPNMNFYIQHLHILTEHILLPHIRMFSCPLVFSWFLVVPFCLSDSIQSLKVKRKIFQWFISAILLKVKMGGNVIILVKSQNGEIPLCFFMHLYS